MSTTIRNRSARGHWFWPGGVFLLLGMNMLIVGITVYAALSDKSVSIEKKYYEKALAWDETAKQRDLNAALGWKVEIKASAARQIEIAIRDSSDQPIRAAKINAEVFHDARSSERATLTFIGDGTGTYRALCPEGPDGSWHLRTRIEAVKMVFTDERSIEVWTAHAANRPRNP
ncbi:MAG: FixH family protein [Phycisphaerales bacterium]|nr:FixH family protein [Phycisphaerales bacterium]